MISLRRRKPAFSVDLEWTQPAENEFVVWAVLRGPTVHSAGIWIEVGRGSDYFGRTTGIEKWRKGLVTPS